jgi:ankyrin repeat protein
MIKKKADVNGRGAMGESPLRVAIEYSDGYCVQQLVSAGAEVNEVIANKNNKTLLMLATENRVHGGVKIRELLGAGANIKARDKSDKTALIHAAINNDIEAVRVLLDHGADKRALDYKGQTAKDYSALLHGKSSKVYRRLILNRNQGNSLIYRLPED